MIRLIGVLAQVDVDPNSDGMPGADLIQKLLNWSQMLALWGSLVLCPPAAWALPAFEEVRQEHQPSDTLILSREGEVLQRVRHDASVRRGPWVALQDVSPALRQALVLSEDKRFFEHSGVDWRAVSAAGMPARQCQHLLPCHGAVNGG